jgi:site-specific recombinase XerD
MNEKTVIVFNSSRKNKLSTELYKSRITIPKDTHFIRHFLTLKASKSIHTATAYETDIKEFFEVEEVELINIDVIRAVTIYDVEDFIMHLSEIGRASGTIHRKVASLSALYRWISMYQDNTTDSTILKYNPFANMKEIKPTLTYSETEFLTREEAVAVMRVCKEDTILDLRNKTILALALTTAIRKKELIYIKLQDITTVQGYDVIKVVRKRNKKDIVKLQAPVRNMIMEYIKRTDRDIEKDASDYLFKGHSTNNRNGEHLEACALNKMINTFCEKNGIKKHLKVHSLRHTALTLAIIAGATLDKVKELAGHESAATTARYIHSVDKLKNNAGDLIDIF